MFDLNKEWDVDELDGLSLEELEVLIEGLDQAIPLEVEPVPPPPQRKAPGVGAIGWALFLCLVLVEVASEGLTKTQEFMQTSDWLRNIQSELFWKAEPGDIWRLYEGDWAFTLPPEYANKTAGIDYQFVGTDAPLRHSRFLIDGLADGKRDGWTSMADEVALLSTQDFGFQEHPDPALVGVQPWKISSDRAAKILDYGAARAVVFRNGRILRQSEGEIEPLRQALLTQFREGACLDWTGVLFQPGARIEFRKDGAIGSAVLDDTCYPHLP